MPGSESTSSFSLVLFSCKILVLKNFLSRMTHMDAGHGHEPKRTYTWKKHLPNEFETLFPALLCKSSKISRDSSCKWCLLIWLVSVRVGYCWVTFYHQTEVDVTRWHIIDSVSQTLWTTVSQNGPSWVSPNIVSLSYVTCLHDSHIQFQSAK